MSRSNPVVSATLMPSAAQVLHHAIGAGHAANAVPGDRYSTGWHGTPRICDRAPAARRRRRGSRLRIAWRFDAPRTRVISSGVTVMSLAASVAANAAGTCPRSSIVVPAMSRITSAGGHSRSGIRNVRFARSDASKLLRIIPLEYRRLPYQQVGICRLELMPCFGRMTRLALGDQQEKRPGDGLVIQPCRALGIGEALDGRRELSRVLPGMPCLRTNSHATWTCCSWWNCSAGRVVSTNLIEQGGHGPSPSVMGVGRGQRQAEHLAQVRRSLACVGLEKGALPSKACRTMPSSKSPSVRSSESASAFSTLSIRFSRRTPVWTRSTMTGVRVAVGDCDIGNLVPIYHDKEDGASRRRRWTR